MFKGHESQQELPVAFRGYDRDATDEAIAKLEKRHARERDDLNRQIESLVQEVESHRLRATAVADALVTAQKMAMDLRTKAEADIEELRRDVEKEREALVEEGAAIKAEARQEATEIVREARIRADRLIDELVSVLEEYQRDTDEFVSGTREQLNSLVSDLLGRIPGSAPDLASTPDESDVPDDAEPEAPAAGIVAA
jgi:cell division septum initiation protein DivIVA